MITTVVREIELSLITLISSACLPCYNNERPAWSTGSQRIQTFKMPFTTGDEHLFELNQVQFDFNVQFEQLFFSILPSALFIVTSFWRTLSQARKPTVVDAPVFQVIKVACYSLKLTHL